MTHFSPQALLITLVLTAIPLSQLRAQIQPDRLLYSRMDGPNGQIRLSDGQGLDTLFINAANGPKLVMSGRHLLYQKNTAVGDPYYGGQFKRLTLSTGVEFNMYNSTAYMRGFDMFGSDSTIVEHYYCNLYHVDFDNATLSTITAVGASCQDGGPNIRQSDELIVFHNAISSLWTIQQDGNNRTAIPNTTEFDTWPMWSPDGQWIVFGRSKALYGPDYLRNTVNYFKVKQNGDSLTQLTWNQPNDAASFTSNAIWTNDGREIIVAGSLNGRYGLMEIAANGSMLADSIPTALGANINYITGSMASNLTSGIADHPSGRSLISVYPNPVTDDAIVVLTPSNSPLGVQLYDASGRCLYTSKIPAHQARVELPMHSFAPGAYHLRVSDGVTVRTLKVIKP